MVLACFKAYDVRGRIGDDLNVDIARDIGRAFAQRLKARRVAVGGDIRLSTPALKAAVIEGLRQGGANVIDLGLTGTEEVYFASFYLDVDGGIQITASHNPADYNGMKFVGRGGRPIGVEDEFADIHRLAETHDFLPVAVQGEVEEGVLIEPYLDHLLSYVDLAALRALKIVTDAGNGAAGHVIDALEKRFQELAVPIAFIKINHEPDGHFPHGVPNPLLPTNRSLTAAAVKQHKANFGIAWDGDFDRCFFFDHEGEFVSGYYIAGLLARIFLDQEPGARFIIDARLDWNTKDIIDNGHGSYVTSKTGHSFFKEQMRRENAIYGGEISAHHYFRKFGFCDSGMIPWLVIAEHIAKSGQSLQSLIAARQECFPCSEEINFKVKDVAQAITQVVAHFQTVDAVVSRIDGVTLDMGSWRFNLRGSNTEPYLRLNLETRGDEALLQLKIKEMTGYIKSLS